MASAIGTPAPARNEPPAQKQKVEEKKRDDLQAKPKDNEAVKVAPPDSEQEAPRSAKDEESTVSRVA
jgi:hypothetical protein